MHLRARYVIKRRGSVFVATTSKEQGEQKKYAGERSTPCVRLTAKTTWFAAHSRIGKNNCFFRRPTSDVKAALKIHLCPVTCDATITYDSFLFDTLRQRSTTRCNTYNFVNSPLEPLAGTNERPSRARDEKTSTNRLPSVRDSSSFIHSRAF